MKLLTAQTVSSGLRLGRMNGILNGINYDENQSAAIRFLQSVA